MLSKWVEITSMNGAIDWYQSKDRKSHFIFWTIVMLIVTIFCIYFTYSTIQEFLDQPTTTRTSIQQNASLEIPEVLICFNGGLNVKKLRKAGFSENFILNFVGSMRSRTANNSQKILFDEEIEEYFRINNANMREFYRQFGYSCQDILIKTSLEGRKQHCQDVPSLYSNVYGRCHLFRSNGIQAYPGLDGGFQLNLKIPPDSFFEFYPSLAAANMFSNSFSVSLDQHFRWITRRWMLASANMRTEIKLLTSKFLRYTSSNPCDPGEFLYSSNTCFHRCHSEAYYKSCNCMLLEYLDSPDDFNYTQICKGTELCSLYNDNQRQTCNEQCRHKNKCEEWIYDGRVTSGSLDAKAMNESLAYLSIGYDTMSYLQVELVDTFTIQTGLANVGGQLGLWFGVSIVTIIQGLYYWLLSIIQQRKWTKKEK